MGVARDAIMAALNNDALSDEQKRRMVRRIKARALRDAAPVTPFTIVDGGLSVTVESVAESDDTLIVVLSATVDGVTVPVDNPFVFVNPPVLVPDPAGDVIRSGPHGEQTGYVEAPGRALAAVVVDAVRTVLR